MGTKLTELRDGCFHAAMDDEPMFVLLARDPSAPELVRKWADKRTGEINSGTRPASDMVKVLDALKNAERMERWRKENDGAWRDGLFGESTECNRQPHGWRCTRGRHHPGPCAAIPVE